MISDALIISYMADFYHIHLALRSAPNQHKIVCLHSMAPACSDHSYPLTPAALTKLSSWVVMERSPVGHIAKKIGKDINLRPCPHICGYF